MGSYSGAGISTAGIRSPTPKRDKRKGNERRFRFYAGQLVADHYGGQHERAGSFPPSGNYLTLATRVGAS
jgi:hypothetical protein